MNAHSVTKGKNHCNTVSCIYVRNLTPSVMRVQSEYYIKKLPAIGLFKLYW